MAELLHNMESPINLLWQIIWECGILNTLINQARD